MLNRTAIERDLPKNNGGGSVNTAALDGLRVLDFTHYVAGPYATMLLADMGAEVIKIEAPGKGDNFRRYPPSDPSLPLQGGAYLWCNRNKKSVTINLKSPKGIEIIKELVSSSDIIVENFSTGVMDRLGLSAKELMVINPRLIYCTVSAYGRTGEFNDRLGFDAIVQAESGFMSMNGYPDRDGVRTAASIMDIGTAMMASNVILSALYEREKSGRGQYVETCLFDTAITMTGYTSMQHLFSGEEPKRKGNLGPDTCPTGVFRASDKAFYLHCGNTEIFDRLFNQVVNSPEIAAEPNLREGAGRLQERERITSILQSIFEEKPWDYWSVRFRAAAVPAGEVRTLGEALHSEEVRARNLITRIEHPEVGWIPNVGSPIRMETTPLIEPSAPPKLGQHTEEFLASALKLDKCEISELRALAVI